MATTNQDIKIFSTDWVPRYADAGYDSLISSLAPQGLFQAEFLSSLNASGSQPDMNLDMLLEYIANRQLAGYLQDVIVVGAALPSAPERNVAPDGFGQDVNGVWFSTPTENPEGVSSTMAYYINGQRVLTQSQDLTVDRSVAKSALGNPQVGDVLQVSIIPTTNVTGWWGRVICT